MRTVLTYAAVAVAASLLSGGVVAATTAEIDSRGSSSPPPGWAWLAGDGTARVGRLTGSGDLWTYAKGNLNLVAQHVRIDGADGNFEFEGNAPESHLNAYTIGTPHRLPISIGGDDGQDILSFVVRGRSNGQAKDLQEWQLGSKVAAAVDGSGRLRLGPLTLVPAVRDGKAVLQAILPNGQTQTLARG